MAYIIYSKEAITLKKRLKDLITELSEGNNNIQVMHFDCDSISEDDLLYECNQLSLTSEIKIVVLNNCLFLTKTKTKVKFSVTEKLLDYLKSENPNCRLIFTVENVNDLDEKNKVSIAVKDNGFIYKTKEILKEDWPIIVDKYFNNNGKKIASDAKNELILRCEYSLNTFYNEANKLISYCEDVVSLEDVKSIVSLPINNGMFAFINCLTSGKKMEALKIYRDIKISTNYTAVSLLNFLATNLILYEEVLYLSMQGLTLDSIASKLKQSQQRIRAIMSNNKKDRIPFIRSALNQLNELDRAIKHSEVDPDYAFEMFILNFKY